MDWKDVAGIVGKIAPLAGAALIGPGGLALGSLIASALGVENTPDAVHAAVASDPAAALKLAEFESENRVKLQALAFAYAENQIAADTAAVQAVNATMQAEARGEHWPSYSWRPMVGMSVAFNVAASSALVLVVYSGLMLGNSAAAGALSTLPGALGALAAINATTLPILGIASYFRGKAQAAPDVSINPRG